MNSSKPLAIPAIVILIHAALLPCIASAGAVFEDLLNYPVIDQVVTKDAVKSEGLVLTAEKKADMVAVTKEQPVGQSFRVGPQAHVLWRICTGLCYWPDDWKPGEVLTFTLWDSPRKSKKLYTRVIDFEHKLQKWDTPFDVHLPTQPNTEYYFEITHNGGGDNSVRVVLIPKNDYLAGKAYIDGKPQDGKDLYFVVLCKSKGDRTANLKKFLDRFDYEQPLLKDAGAAYKAGDLDKACSLVLATFKQYLKTSEFLWKVDPNFNPKEADAIADENRLYREKEGQKAWITMSDQTTWHEVWEDGQRFIGQNDVFRQLGWAYAVTKDEKYARKLNELMADFMQDNPSPFEGGMWGARWSAMGIGWRLGDAWNGPAAALDSKGLTDDVLLGWIEYQSRMAHFSATHHSGGNQANATAEALMKFAANFPLYKASKEQFQFGFDKLVGNSLKIFRDDGGCTEPAMNYHGYSLATLMEGLKTARKFKMDIPPAINKVVEKALAYTAYILKPDGTIPPYGDTDCEEFRADKPRWDGWRKGEAMEGYTQFGRKDMLYIATAGKEGERPAATSVSFPNTGHYIMRSDWGGENGKDFEQARWLFLRGGKAGSHGHDDLNMINLYAYGRPLLLEPGRSTYGTELMYELARNRSHNVLLVDDLDKMQHPGPKLNSWHTSPAMDYVDNTYEGLYPDVNHRRAVVFVRPDYFVMFDDATAKKPHRVGINFWLPPPALAIDQKSQSVMTNEPAGSNLLLKVVTPAKVEIAQRNGRIDLGGKRDDIPVVTFWQNNTNNADFVTLMYPFPKNAKAVDIPASVTTAKEAVLCEIGNPSQKDYVYCNAHPGTMQSKSQVMFNARAGLIRMAKDTVASFALVDGTRIACKGTLATSAKMLPSLSVRYLDDSVEVVCEKEEPSLEIAAFGRTKATVNGKARTFSGERFKPFQ